MPSDSRGPSPLLGMAAIAVSYLVGVAAILGVALALRDTTGDSGGGGGSAETNLPIKLSEFKIEGVHPVKPGKVTFAVTNGGLAEHNLVVADTGNQTKNLAAGGSDTVSADLEAGTYELFCSIPGHKESGMKADLVVAADSAGAATGGTAAMDHSANSATPEEWAAMDAKMIENMKSFPAKTEGLGNAVLEPTIAADGTKQYTFDIGITKWELEPGKIVDAWTYNGMVPGPWVKVNVGDKVALTFTNNLPMNTDVHLHGIDTPNSMDGVSPYTQDPIKPGETFTYSFTTTRQQLGMYHAHAHGETSVPNGMFAVFQVGDIPLPAGRTFSGITVPKDVKPVQEIPMVLNDSGSIGLSLNGKSFPATAPVVAKQGDWFVVNYFNEGQMVHPMHMHGFPQLVVAKDGWSLDQPYLADTVLVGPGERYSVLVQASALGTWVWHCHILNHVEQKDRLFGMATAVVVQPAA